MSSIQTEVDASYLYTILAIHEENPTIKNIFTQMSEIEKGHALGFMKNNNISLAQLPGPSWRAKTLHTIGKIFGYDYILGVVLSTEQRLANGVMKSRETLNSPKSLSDTAHVVILQNILKSNEKIPGSNIARFEKKSRSIGGNALRAAVLGGNDGLVSNFSLIMGIAGATNGQKEVLIAGLAGLLAGALSMALGERISVKSSQELYENQMQLEMDELETNPEGEEQELALIYISKGVPEAEAKAMAKEIMLDKEHAHEVLVREELGINPEELQGSAMEAAISSFICFAFGAIIPVIPFFFTGGMKAILISTGLSAIGLFLIGSIITLFTGRSVQYSGMRQVLFGLIAAAITFGIGKMIGISI